jgi:DNA-binding FrmR family transcriptional regulator
MEKATTYLSEEQQKRFRNRISRIEGQIGALKRALEEDACADDLILLASAPRGALRQLVANLLEHHLLACATSCMEGDQDEILRRVSRAVSTAMKQA